MTVEAIFDAWFVGDQFLLDSVNSLPALKSQAIAKKRSIPYLYEYYNIFSYVQKADSAVKTVIARVNNAVLEGLNTRSRLPRYLVVILDNNLVAEVNIFNNDAMKEWRTCTKWLVRQIDMNIKHKRLELLEKRPGAVYDEDPRIVYVKMIRRAQFYPTGSKAAKLCTMRSKFNNILNEIVAAEGHYILGIESCSTADCFDSFGKLSTKGKYHYWSEMLELMEKFDKKKIKLVPIPYRKKNNTKNAEYRQDKEDRYGRR